MSFIDVIDGMKALWFPLQTRFFVVAMLRDALGGFTLNFQLEIKDQFTIDTPSISIPLQDSNYTNVAIPTPILTIAKPSVMRISILADGVPFFEDRFEFLQVEGSLALESPQSPSATIRQ